MAVIMLSIIPIIIVYMFCQKHIIKGVVAGAVKGSCWLCAETGGSGFLYTKEVEL